VSLSFEMDQPDRATVGTVGAPGQRTFFLQVTEASSTMSLKVEKQQVGALGELISEMLADLPAPGEELDANALGLAEPVEADWAVGSIQLAYDADRQRIVLGLEEAVEDDAATGRVALSLPQAAAIAQRSALLLESGRPTCPLCGNPMDPSGHACPRTNGHRPRTP
jgi:uncharacterized repeat protein (TIGR03847 family)